MLLPAAVHSSLAFLAPSIRCPGRPCAPPWVQAYAVVLHDYIAVNADELSLRQGETVAVFSKVPPLPPCYGSELMSRDATTLHILAAADTRPDCY